MTATTSRDQAADRLVDHEPPERLLAMRGLAAGPSPLVSDDLYVRATRGTVTRTRDGVSLAPRAAATTNTYFGRFPASYWQRWTDVDEVVLGVQARGAGRLALRASDSAGTARTVAVADVSASGPVELRAAVDRFADGGALWLELTTGEGELAVEALRWTVAGPRTLRPAAVVICTFNRPDDCVATLRAMAEDPGALAGVDAVYVVDQGNRLVADAAGYEDVAARLGERLVHLTQPNLGGAGGFTRGLYEVAGAAGAEHANVVFMDDDVLCEPETVLRLNAFANRTVEPTIVGAQMLNLLHPDQLHVGAETADLPALAAGKAVPEAFSTKSVLRKQQDVRVDAGYNGWWSCLIPAEVVARVGYPLPVFFQWDDIEYGYRAREAGHATVTLPGAAVWHADFAWKDWDDWHRYFNIRNAMITAALHDEFDGKAVAKGLRAQLVRYLVSMQYGLAETMIKAVEDFCLGPEHLADGGRAAAADIRAVRAAHPETVRHPASAVPGVGPAEAPIVRAAPAPALKRTLLAKRALWQLLDRTDPATVAVPADDAAWYHVSRYDRVVVTDSSQEGVRVRTRDNDTAKELLRRGLRACAALRRDAPELRSRYRAALPGLTDRSNWARLFGDA